MLRLPSSCSRSVTPDRPAGLTRRAFAVLGVPFSAAFAVACAHRAPAAAPPLPYRAGAQVPRESPGGYRSWLYVPAGYDGARALPLVVFLHGSGERGSDLELVKKHGPPKMIAAGHAFPFIVVSPQCPAETWWSECRVMAAVDDLLANLRIDRARVYLTGLSMGGAGTWEVAARHPDRFAAILPICGAGDQKRFAKRLIDMPTWAFHGDQDTAVPLERSVEMIDAMNAANAKEAKLTVYPGVGHDSWTATYENPEVFAWLLSHARQPQP